ncbi:MAG TPA: carbonic anhydrase [Gemmataceae bacterium]|nr:carbonic anhydrase [Gemmataceae bacterium]
MQPLSWTRRRLLLTAGALPFALRGAAGSEAACRNQSLDDAPPVDAAEALERLKAGNQRFVEGRMQHPHEAADWRKSLIKAQTPFATVLCCSDSRVPAELVFDEGLGDLFVVRVAGNIVDDDVAGSIQYGVLHLKIPLLVVLGHEGCGAVSATLEAIDGAPKEPRYIEELVDLIKPGLKDLDPKLKGDERLAAAAQANVRWSMRRLLDMTGVLPTPDAKRFRLAGGVYEMETGRVRFTD